MWKDVQLATIITNLVTRTSFFALMDIDVNAITPFINIEYKSCIPILKKDAKLMVLFSLYHLTLSHTKTSIPGFFHRIPIDKKGPFVPIEKWKEALGSRLNYSFVKWKQMTA